jgi:hypothetical protein
MVERSLSMREAPGSIPGLSSFDDFFIGYKDMSYMRIINQSIKFSGLCTCKQNDFCKLTCQVASGT